MSGICQCEPEKGAMENRNVFSWFYFWILNFTGHVLHNSNSSIILSKVDQVRKLQRNQPNPAMVSGWTECTSTKAENFLPFYKSARKQWIILQYVNTGKYCFILQILILGLFTEVLLISILMLSIQNIVLIYWYFQYFTVSVFYVWNH